MSKFIFPSNFAWGVATAAYQIEGAVKEDGRGESIWDRFCHTPGRIENGDTGDIACDHYHRYKTDVALMRALGIKSYRFSIAWPRVFPLGTGKVNLPGIDFYKKLTDELLQNGIEPLVTLYHWDLPQALQDKGGWDNRDTISYYADYAAYVFQALGDRVQKWLTFNEPAVTSLVGHAFGEHAPGLQDYPLAIRVSHHLNISHAKAVQIFRQLNQQGEIGGALSLSSIYPASASPADQAAARMADGHFNRWYLEPILKGTYPEDMLKFYVENLHAPIIKPGDMELLAGASIDFLGVNYYFRMLVKQAVQENLQGFERLKPAGLYTEMGWEVYPQGLYDLLIRLDHDYNQPKIYITENGAAFKDILTAGRIADSNRQDYLRQHFIAAHQAIQNGVKLAGYYIWSLMDNFEWAHGYSKRFGIFYTDYQTLNRIWKDSAYWYQEVIKNNGF